MKHKDHVRKTQLFWVFCIQNFLDAPRALEFIFTLEWFPTPRLKMKVERLYQFTNKCYRIFCLRHWHLWLICSLSSLQIVTVWTNVSRLPTKMTPLSRLTMHLVLRKDRLLQINPNLSRWWNFYRFDNLTNRGFDSFTHNFTHRRLRRRWKNKVCGMGSKHRDACWLLRRRLLNTQQLIKFRTSRSSNR